MSAADASDASKYEEFARVVQEMAVCKDNEQRAHIEASYRELVTTAPSFVVAALARMIVDPQVAIVVS